MPNQKHCSTHRRRAAVREAAPVSSSNPFSGSHKRPEAQLHSAAQFILPRCSQPTAFLLSSPEPRLCEAPGQACQEGGSSRYSPAVCGVRPGTAVYEQTKPNSPLEIYTDMGGGSWGKKPGSEKKSLLFSLPPRFSLPRQ